MTADAKFLRFARGLYRSGRDFTSLQLSTIGFVFLVCVCVVGSQFQTISSQRDKELKDAWAQAGNLARSLGQQATDTVLLADLSILGATQRLEIDGTTPDTLDKLRQIMVARVSAFPALANFVITDETGRCLVVSLPKMPGDCSLAGRADFEYHHTHADKDAHLGAPLRAIGLDTWIIPVSRRYTHPDGSFAGIVMTGISIPFFQNYYDTFDIGARGSILMATNTDDPVLLVRRPFIEANLGRSLRGGGIFSAMAASKGAFGDVETNSLTDGIRRLVSYQRLGSYPLVIAVSLAKDDALADWRDSARSRILITIGLVTVIATLGAWLALHIRMRRQLEDSHREAAAAFRLLAENSTDFIVRLGPHNERVYVSPACRTLLGYEPEELMGHDPLEMVHPDDHEIWRRHYDVNAPGDDRSAVYRAIRKDGGIVWVEASRRRLESEGGYVVTLRDVTEREAAERQLAEANRRLQDMADHDGLTGLANRRAFDEALDAEFRRATRAGTPLSLIMIDVDRFKAFNDAYGHPAGDRCLRDIAAVLKDIPGRPGDFVARYGGEELAIVLPNTPLAGALTIAEQAREAIRALAIKHERNDAGIVTISLGVAAVTKDGTIVTPASLIEAADRALYAAKKGGRDAACAAAPDAQPELAMD